jgi:N-methylhydantoinase A
MGYRVGVDIGGSFTDFAVLNEHDGSIETLKVFSRPDKPGHEVLEGISQLKSRYSIAPDEISYFTHGTTVGVNTVIQRKGLKLALFATEGFLDVLELARMKIANMYDIFSKRPRPLITRDCAFAIKERIAADGEVLVPLSRESVTNAIARAQAKGCEGIVVSLLHSYRNGAHEKKIKEIAAEIAPDLPVFLSREVWPIIREYERTITAAVSGYVQPRVAHYLSSLQGALTGVGVTPEPQITKSNGGVMTAEQGKSECIQMILSGTASGVIGASFVAKTVGVNKALSLDIGGTSADVALILDGTPQYGVGELIGEFQIFIPSVSVSSIGEGGGSIAWIDDLGVLKVGPESAGSSPGPVCYGRGGTRPTVTDSLVACGLIGSADLGYNAVKLDVEGARRSLGTLAEQLGTTIEKTAEAIQKICISGMYGGISGLVSRFGIDPREYTMIAFGGAGPMLAPMLARELGMSEVLVPTTPGVLSALGGLVADMKNDFIDTVYLDVVPGIERTLRESGEALRVRGITWLVEEQGYKGEPKLLYSAEMRYSGQSFEVETPLDGRWIASGNLTAIANAFHDRHEQLFGHCDRKAATQLISLRLVASGETKKPSLPPARAGSGAPKAMMTVRAWLDGAFRDVSLFRRADCLAGQSFSGPAVVVQDDCTTVVPPGCDVTVDALGNLRIAIHAR